MQLPSSFGQYDSTLTTPIGFGAMSFLRFLRPCLVLPCSQSRSDARALTLGNITAFNLGHEPCMQPDGDDYRALLWTMILLAELVTQLTSVLPNPCSRVLSFVVRSA